MSVLFPRFFLRDDPLCDRYEGRYIFHCGLPNHSQIDAEVMVNQIITHPSHLSPGDLLVSLPHLLQDSICRLSNNLQGTNDRKHGLVIGDKLTKLLKSVKYILQKVSIDAFWTHTRTTSSKMTCPRRGLRVSRITRSTGTPSRSER